MPEKVSNQTLDRDLQLLTQDFNRFSERNKGDLNNLAERLQRVEIKIDGTFATKEELKNYVTKDSFYPVRNIAYGSIGLLVVTTLTLIGTVFTLVMKFAGAN